MTTTSRWACGRWRRGSVLTLALILSGCNVANKTFEIGGYSYSTDRFEQWKLPRSLREISGLAGSADGRLFAHADERAVIHQIDYRSGKRLKTFSLSHRSAQSSAKADKAIKGDFEGIAVVGEQLYLVTSKGTLFTARLGADESSVSPQSYKTGLGDRCEIEGLAYHADRHVLLMACKAVRDPQLDGHVVIFQWSLDLQTLLIDQTIKIPLAALAASLQQSADKPKFNSSGITVSPRNGNLVLVAARQKAMLEVTLGGEIVSVFTLPMQRYHRQPEGIALFADGTLLLADEGGNKRGRLGVYRAVE